MGEASGDIPPNNQSTNATWLLPGARGPRRAILDLMVSDTRPRGTSRRSHTRERQPAQTAPRACSKPRENRSTSAGPPMSASATRPIASRHPPG